MDSPGAPRGRMGSLEREMALLLLCGQAVKSFAQVHQLLLVLQLLVQALGNSIQAVEQSKQAARDGPCGPTLTWNGNTGPQGSQQQRGKGCITVNLTLTRASLPRARLRDSTGLVTLQQAVPVFSQPSSPPPCQTPVLLWATPYGPWWLLLSPVKKTGVSLSSLLKHSDNTQSVQMALSSRGWVLRETTSRGDGIPESPPLQALQGGQSHARLPHKHLTKIPACPCSCSQLRDLGWVHHCATLKVPSSHAYGHPAALGSHCSLLGSSSPGGVSHALEEGSLLA